MSVHFLVVKNGNRLPLTAMRGSDKQGWNVWSGWGLYGWLALTSGGSSGSAKQPDGQEPVKSAVHIAAL